MFCRFCFVLRELRVFCILITVASDDFLANAFRACITITVTAANTRVNIPVRAPEFGVAGFAEAASIKATIGPFSIAPRHIKCGIHSRQYKEVLAFILFADDADAMFAFAAITCSAVFKSAAFICG